MQVVMGYGMMQLSLPSLYDIWRDYGPRWPENFSKMGKPTTAYCMTRLGQDFGSVKAKTGLI
jgi:hypothetical protein